MTDVLMEIGRYLLLFLFGFAGSSVLCLIALRLGLYDCPRCKWRPGSPPMGVHEIEMHRLALFDELTASRKKRHLQ